MMGPGMFDDLAKDLMKAFGCLVAVIVAMAGTIAYLSYLLAVRR